MEKPVLERGLRGYIAAGRYRSGGMEKPVLLYTYIHMDIYMYIFILDKELLELTVRLPLACAPSERYTL